MSTVTLRLASKVDTRKIARSLSSALRTPTLREAHPCASPLHISLFAPPRSGKSTFSRAFIGNECCLGGHYGPQQSTAHGAQYSHFDFNYFCQGLGGARHYEVSCNLEITSRESLIHN